MYSFISFSHSEVKLINFILFFEILITYNDSICFYLNELIRLPSV